MGEGGEAEEKDGPRFCPGSSPSGGDNQALTQAHHVLMKPVLWMGKLRLGVGHLVSLASDGSWQRLSPALKGA